MASIQIATVEVRNATGSTTTEASTGIPWYIWCAVVGLTSGIIGGHWDISWHRSIGRDTFWTPAHLAIHLCGVLSGVAFGYLILATTFSKTSRLANSSVHIWGFRGPVGAFAGAWGGIAMLTSAPFDNWWHDAYGLDVKIVSPPHILLFIGIYGVYLGTLLIISGHINRSSEPDRRAGRWLLLYVFGLMLVTGMVVIFEYTNRVLLHTALPYILIPPVTLLIVVTGKIATDFRFAATFIASVYTLFLIAFILVLPLFPAEPKLGPVYQHVTHFVPPEFPILVIIPALIIDLLWPVMRRWWTWVNAAAAAAVFTALLVATEWPFANFLMSPASRNRFFGTMYFSYGLPPTSYTARHQFLPFQSVASLWVGLTIAVLISAVAVRFAISCGRSLREVER